MRLFLGWGPRAWHGFFVFLLLGVGIPTAADGQEALGPLDLEGRTITEISFNYRGPKTVPEQRLRNHMSVRVGQKYRTDAIDEDIASLYESGLVDDVSFLVKQGECLGLVGESGCGKTTVSKLIMRAVTADAGKVEFDGREGKVDIRALHPVAEGVADGYSASSQGRW